MQNLAHKDWLRLEDVVLDLHSAEHASDIPARILDGLRWVIPCDSASLQDDRGGARNVPWLRPNAVEWQSTQSPDVRGLRMMPSWGCEYLPFREAWLAVSVERHPHTDYFQRTGDGRAKRLSELMSKRALRRTSFYNELMRPSRLNSQLTIYLHLPSAGTLTLAACRQGLDFSERECSLLEVLRPHVQIAWKRFAQSRPVIANTTTMSENDDGADLVRLGITRREAEVLRWITAGKTNPEICIILQLSRSTVKTHVARLLAKLGCENRTSLAAAAWETRRGAEEERRLLRN